MLRSKGTLLEALQKYPPPMPIQYVPIVTPEDEDYIFRHSLRQGSLG